MKYYKIDFRERKITRIDIVKETANFICVKELWMIDNRLRRILKTSSANAYRKTYNEAVNCLVDHYKSKIKRQIEIEKRVKKLIDQYKIDLEEIRQMKEK